MRIVENNAERLVLKGVPGSLRWMLFAALLGLGLMASTGWFAWVLVEETGGYLQAIPLGIGFLLGSVFFLMGVVTLALGRMQLVLDRESDQGSYKVCSPVVDVGKPCSFRLGAIDSVTVERQEEDRPHIADRGNFPAKVCRVRLRIRSPRRAIVLDETENGRDRRVEAIAEEVATWLGLEVTRP